MSDSLIVTTTPTRVDSSGEVTITNLGDQTVYYAANPNVSPAVNDGSLASGASLTPAGTVWLVVASDRGRLRTSTGSLLSAASGTGESVNVTAAPYNAKCDVRRITDAAMTSVPAPNANRLTSATANFTAADVGKQVYVYSAATGSTLLQGTVTAYVSATQVDLSANAGTTVSGVEAFIGTDDSAAINAAIGAGTAEVFIPRPTLVHAASIMLRSDLVLRGAGSDSDPAVQSLAPGTNGLRAATTIVGLGGSGTFITIDTPAAIRNFAVEKLAVICRKGAAATDSRNAGAMGIRINDSCTNWHLSDVDGAFASQGIKLRPSVQMGYLQNVHWREARNHNLCLEGNVNQVTTLGGCLFQVADSFGVAAAGTNPANVALLASAALHPTDIKFLHNLWDETGLLANHSCLYVEAVENLTVEAERMYPPTGGYGIYLSAGVQRARIRVSRIEPYNNAIPPDRVPANTIFIDPAIPVGSVLIHDTSTNPNTGGDISDTAGVAIQRNVNGRNTADRLYQPSYPPDVVATADSIEVGTAAITGGTNRIIGGRAIMKRAGTLVDLWVWTGVAGTNIQGAVYDVGATTSAVRTLKWSGASVAGAASAWVKLGDPNLAVVAGQHLDFAVQVADNTTTIGRRAGQAQPVSTLPANFAIVGGCLFKAGWMDIGPTTFVLPATLAETDAASLLGAYPVLIARIV